MSSMIGRSSATNPRTALIAALVRMAWRDRARADPATPPWSAADRARPLGGGRPFRVGLEERSRCERRPPDVSGPVQPEHEQRIADLDLVAVMDIRWPDGRPLTKVGLRGSQSRTRTSPWLLVRTHCRGDTLGSAMARSLASSRPIRIPFRSTASNCLPGVRRRRRGASACAPSYYPNG